MTGCDDLRRYFSALLEGELETREATALRQHLETCASCRDLYAVMADDLAAGGLLAQLEPREEIKEELQRRPCERWLALLFAAVDHELPGDRLDGLVEHLDRCSGCRRAWSDLALLHQAGEAVKPPPGLVQRCMAVPRPVRHRQIFGVRAATAAAYVLAVLTSLLVGNPVSLARHATPAVQQVTSQVTLAVHSEVAEAAATGRGELRVLLWRTWQWGAHQAEAVRTFFLNDDHDDDTGSSESQGGQS